MSHHRETLAALQHLRSGAASLSFDEYVALLDAVEQAYEALLLAPRGSDPVATGLWWHHERAPALDRLADTLSGYQGSEPRAGSAGRIQAGDAPVIRALQQSLLENSPYHNGK